MKARGACPGITTPMQTGDGLLARLIPEKPIPIDALCTLCEAAEEHGNGIVEVTQRGSLQIRGLTESSAPDFARIIASLQIGADNGPPLLTSALLGLDAGEPFDCTALVSSLRRMLSRQPNLESLGPKVSVLIDGGGRLHLDEVAADIRLVATSKSLLQLSVAGNARDAVHLGHVAIDGAAAAVGALLQQIANRGPTARARDLAQHPTIRAIRVLREISSSFSDRLSDRIRDRPGCRPIGDTPTTNDRPPAETVGVHPLVTGNVARGFALPFGHSTARALTRFANAAAANGASAIRPAPGRSLLAVGLSEKAADRLCVAAAAEGFVVDPDDPRRHVVACAGSPACASARLPTRQLAPEVARAIQSFVGTSNVVHLSGCSKGCAHPGPAALTIVGPDHVILRGRAGDTPHATLSAAGLIADVERLSNELSHV